MRVGVPRALGYYRLGPGWLAYIRGLGLDPVVSPPTHRGIVDRGCALAVGDQCLSLKVFLGHVSWLLDRGVDALFLPRVIAMRPGRCACPKFIGLPYLVRAAFGNLPPLLTPRLDANSRFDPEGMAALGMRLVRSPARVKDALDRMEEGQGQAESAAREGADWGEVLAAAERGEAPPSPRHAERGAGGVRDGGGVSLGVIGHPYLLYDTYVNLNLLGRLRRFGAAPILLPESFSAEELAAGPDPGFTWDFADRIVGASFAMRARGVRAMVLLSAFSCGPDPLMIDHVLRTLGPELPVLTVILDEHTGEAGLSTRIETFMDMIARIGGGDGPGRRRWSVCEQPGGRNPPDRMLGEDGSKRGAGRGRTGRRMGRGRVRVSSFNLGRADIGFRAFIEALGLTYVPPPPTSRESVEMGLRLSPEGVCFPFKVFVGNFLGAAERGTDAILLTRGRTACRYSDFGIAISRVLRNAGYDVDVIVIDHAPVTHFLDGFQRLDPDITAASLAKAFALLVAKLKAVDWVEANAALLRPREARRGSVTRAANLSYDAIEAASNVREARSAARAVQAYFDSIELHPGPPLAKVGLIGDVYSMSDPAINMDIERSLGEMGVLVERSMTLGDLFLNLLPAGPFRGDRSNRALRAIAKPYLPENVGGFGTYTVAHALRMIEEGVDGLIHVAPFACTPELVAEPIVKRLCAERGVPLLDIAVDEQTATTGLVTRLEAFIDLLVARRGARP